MFKFLSVVITLGFLQGCQDRNTRRDSMPQYEFTSESFAASLSTKKYVDVIYVIDDSGSMSPYQEAMSANFTKFIQSFEGTDLDFHFSVISTSQSGGRCPDGLMNNSHTNLTAAAMATDSAAFVADFQAAVQIGSEGSGDEMGLWNLKRHIERFGPESGRPYHREFAQTVVVYLSDELDHSATSPAASEPETVETGTVSDEDNAATALEYLSYYKEALGKEEIKFFAITSAGLNTVRWNTLVSETGGVSASIDEDFALTLESLSSFVTDQSVFNLVYMEKAPKVDEFMEVIVNGELLPVDNWKYFHSNQLIMIDKTLVKEGDQIDIRFHHQVNEKHIPSAF
ncbi:MAG: VWA domain-containing protein [Pseudobacteriovorax sp.]|nr:VWA domain-containing protein [Pseudobacteriovorax sp.]